MNLSQKKGLTLLQSSVQLWVYWHKWVSAWWRTWLICAKWHLVIQRRIWNRIRELFFLCEQNLHFLILTPFAGRGRQPDLAETKHIPETPRHTARLYTFAKKKPFDCDSIESKCEVFQPGGDKEFPAAVTRHNFPAASGELFTSKNWPSDRRNDQILYS